MELALRVAATNREWTVTTSVSSTVVCVHRWCLLLGGFQHMLRTRLCYCTTRRERRRRRKRTAKRERERKVCALGVMNVRF